MSSETNQPIPSGFESRLGNADAGSIESAAGTGEVFTGVGFLTQKPKEDPASCQDRVNVSDDGKLIVVADGVTTSLQGGKWAELLVNAFVQDPPGDSADVKWFEAAQSEWKNYLAGLARKEKPGSITITRIQCLEPGAATLIAVRLVRSDTGNLQIEVMACGDSCALVSRGGRLVYSFPKRDPAEFDNFRATIKSNTVPGTLESLLQRDGCELEEGDVIFLATDAMAKLLLSHAGEVLEQCLQLDEPAQFRQFVSEQRALSLEALDYDVTLIRVTVSATQGGLTIFPSDLVQADKPGDVKLDYPQGPLPSGPSVPVSTAPSPQNEPAGPSPVKVLPVVASLVAQPEPVSPATTVNDAPRHGWAAIVPWTAIVLLAMASVSLFMWVRQLSAELVRVKMKISGGTQNGVPRGIQNELKNEVRQEVSARVSQALDELKVATETMLARARQEMTNSKAPSLTELKTEAGAIRNNARAGMEADENAVVQDLRKKTADVIAGARQEMDGGKVQLLAGVQRDVEGIRVKAKADMETSGNQLLNQLKLYTTNTAKQITELQTRLSTALEKQAAKAMTPPERTFFLPYNDTIPRDAFKQISEFANLNFPDQSQHGPSGNMMMRISARLKGKDASTEFYSAFCKSEEGRSLGMTFKLFCMNCGDSGGVNNDSFLMVSFVPLAH